MAVGLLASMMDVPPSSRASPLPHRFLVVDKISVHRRSLWGAKLARDSGGSACIDVGCAGLFAGKPAPTLDLQWARNLCSAQFPLWEQSLLAMAVGLLASMLNVPPPSRASSAPKGPAQTDLMGVRPGEPGRLLGRLVVDVDFGAPLTTMAERRHCGVGIPAWMPG